MTEPEREPQKNRAYRRRQLRMFNRTPVELAVPIAVKDGKPVFGTEASVRAPTRRTAGKLR